MPIDRYTTFTIAAMVEELEVQRGFWTALAFSNVQFFDTDVIEWDIKTGGRPVAPFVHPLVAAPTIAREGYITKAMKPAYIKLKSAISPTDALMRTAGEGYNNSQLSPSERMDRLMAQSIAKHDEMISNRIEWMASKAILDGKYTVEGEAYEPTVVDFGHPSALRVALSGGALWSATTALPIDDIEDLAQTIRRMSKGAVVDTVVFHTTAWPYFRNNETVKERINQDYAPGMVNKSQLDLGVQLDPTGLNWVGRLDGKIDLYTYDDYLSDNEGADVALMPDNTVVVMARAALSGAQYYGAIMSGDNGFQPVRMYSKSRSNWDPEGEEHLSQSAPLVAPSRMNTWGVLTVA